MQDLVNMTKWLQVALTVAAMAVCAVPPSDGNEYPTPFSKSTVPACFYTKSNSMNCDGMGLQEVPSGLWPGITVLSLDHNNITSLNTDSFSGFPDLYMLYLQNNPLTSVDLGVFSNAPTHLYLSNNRIEHLTSDGATCKELRYLYLVNNSISHLDPDVFAAAPNLEYVFLDQNPLVVADGEPILIHPKLELVQSNFGQMGKLGPRSLARLPKLRIGNLDYSGITDITGAFVANSELTTIALQTNQITEVKAGTFPEEGKVLNLWLNANPLTSLPVAAVARTMAPGGRIGFGMTPLACSCGYEDLHRWASENQVELLAGCGVDCDFSE